MKRSILKKVLLVAITLTSVIGFAKPDKVIKIYSKGSVIAEYKADVIDYIQVEDNEYIDSHEYVDLGLPSGLKWATMNIGATKPSDYGDYFAWGETTTKSDYTESNSKTYGKDLGDISGNPEYDAARANWGGTWRMPKSSELQELIDKCKWEWATKDGGKGYLVTGPNGKQIFLPVAGYRLGSSLYGAGSGGKYWSSTPYDSERRSYSLGFGIGSLYTGGDSRYNGHSVRPVSDDSAEEPSANPTTPTGFIENQGYVDLGLPSGLKWATVNIGASQPNEYGDYFAWGETTTKSDYTVSNSKTYGKDLGDISGNPGYDAARANWGGTWRMPKESEFQELIDNCKWEEATLYGVDGCLVTGPNGKQIFLPFAGYRSGSSHPYAGSDGHYWSSKPLRIDNSYELNFNTGFRKVLLEDRDRGQSVRPVSD